MAGWVKIHRALADHELWLAEPFTYGQAWVDLVLCTNHAPGSFTVRRQRVALERGQIGWSEVTMTKRWKWSRGKVRRFLKRLESDSMIEQQAGHLTSVITICNYDDYQSKQKEGDTSNDTASSTSGGTLDGQQAVHKQECKEELECKNDKNDKKTIDQTDVDRMFGFFYLAYPKKVDKKKASDKFGMIFRGKQPAQADELLDTIIINIEQRIAAGGWDLSNKHFIPGPAKYLLNKSWEDEVIGAPNAAHQRPNQQPAIDHNDTSWGDDVFEELRNGNQASYQRPVQPIAGQLPSLETGLYGSSGVERDQTGMAQVVYEQPGKRSATD